MVSKHIESELVNFDPRLTIVRLVQHILISTPAFKFIWQISKFIPLPLSSII